MSNDNEATLTGGEAADVAQVMAQVNAGAAKEVPNQAVAGLPIRSTGPPAYQQQPAMPPAGPPAISAAMPRGPTHPFGNQYLTGSESAAAAHQQQLPADPRQTLAYAIDLLANRVMRSAIDPQLLAEGERISVDRDVYKLQALLAYEVRIRVLTPG